jgi:hypothetical protein
MRFDDFPVAGSSNFKVKRKLASVTAPSETKRFPSPLKHKPSGYLSSVEKLLFVPIRRVFEDRMPGRVCHIQIAGRIKS